VPKPAQQTSFSLALNQIHSEGIATTQEMAMVCECSVSHIQDVVSICDPAQLSLGKAIELSHWLVDEKGETRQLQAIGGKDGFLGSTGEVHFKPESYENDDDIQPEVFDARQDAALAIEALEAGDREEAARQIRDGIGDFHEALQDIQNPA